MTFHFDENVAEFIAIGLRRRGIDVTISKEAGLIGASDEEQLAYAKREQRVIVTHDADLLRLASAGFRHAGIAYCRGAKLKSGQLVAKLLALTAVTTSEAMQNRIEFL